MAAWDPATYGERVAEVYDDWWGVSPEVTGAVEFLAARSGAGPVLELGIGSGRIALPLSERGVEVHGIDASEAMVGRLRDKPGAEAIRIHVGNFADVDVEAGTTYSLIFVTVGTFFQLTTQEEQVRCFQNAAARLAGGGLLVVDVEVPDFSGWSRNQTTMVVRVGRDEVLLVAAQHDPVAQLTTWQNVLLTERGVRLFPDRNRYAGPGELDLMGRIAGLRLRERHGGWQGEPFTGTGRHISVYGAGSP